MTVAFPSVRTPRDAARLAEEVFALPPRIADTLGRRLVIALDEFQAIGIVQRRRSRAGAAGRGTAAAPGRLRLRRLRADADGADDRPEAAVLQGRAGDAAQKIPAATFAAFVDRRFTRSGISPEAGLGAAVVDLAGNLPYDVQRLAHETWDDVVARSPQAGDARRSPRDAASAARRTRNACLKRCGSVSRWPSAAPFAPSCSNTASRTARGRRPRTPSARRRLDRPGGAGGAATRRHHRPRRRRPLLRSSTH